MMEVSRQDVAHAGICSAARVDNIKVTRVAAEYCISIVCASCFLRVLPFEQVYLLKNYKELGR
jgi:hypothetical protein